MRGLLLVALLSSAHASRADDGPFDVPGHPVTTDAAAPATEPPTPIPLPLRTYRFAGRFQGPRCPHRPSCSAYAAQAIGRHGWILGSFAGVARLLRGEWSSAARPLARDTDGLLLDPLGDSTFFLEPPQ